jgi:hypothetical protein
MFFTVLEYSIRQACRQAKSFPPRLLLAQLGFPFFFTGFRLAHVMFRERISYCVHDEEI